MLSFRSFKGPEINAVKNEFAQLRIAVFKDFPYLYEGSLAYEMSYIETYSKAENSFLFGIFDGDQLVGASTCIPLPSESHEVKKPFVEARLSLNSIFYFGESILLLPYRGLGFGHRFFDEREAYARTFPTCNTTVFCSVNRSDSHPLKPAHYRPNDTFWLKRGYSKQEALQCSMSWLDVNENEPSAKKLTFWSKKI